MTGLETADRPPPAGPAVQIERINARCQVQVCFVCDKIEWVNTHWKPAAQGRKGYSLPHIQPAEECPGCQKQLPQKWRGFIDVLVFKPAGRAFYEITPGAAEDIEAMLPEVISLRGLVVMLTRMNGNTTRLKVQLMPHWDAYNAAPLPPSRSVIPILKKLWAYNAPLPECLRDKP